MSSPLSLQKITVKVAALKQLPAEQRSAILLLGHLLNEANWLRKLLVQAVIGTDDPGPEGAARFGLVVILASTLASKLHEGWLALTSVEVGPTLRNLVLPPELAELRRTFRANVEEGTIAKIRNSFGFHYPRQFDIDHLGEMEDADSLIYTTESAYNGDLFSYLSALAAVNALVADSAGQNWHEAFQQKWETVTEASGQYCKIISETLAVALKTWLPEAFEVEIVTVPEAPRLDDMSLVFFAHPPKIFDGQ